MRKKAKIINNVSKIGRESVGDCEGVRVAELQTESYTHPLCSPPSFIGCCCHLSRVNHRPKVDPSLVLLERDDAMLSSASKIVPLRAASRIRDESTAFLRSIRAAYLLSE